MQTTCFGHMDSILMFCLVTFLISYLLFLLQDRFVNLEQQTFAFLKCLLLNSHRPYLLCLLCTVFRKVLSKVQREDKGHQLLSSHQLHISPEELTWQEKEQQTHITWHSLQNRTQQQSWSPNIRTAPRSGSSPMTAAQGWGKGQSFLHNPERNMHNFTPPRNQHSCCTENKPSAKTHFPRTQLAKGRVIKENEFSFVWCQGFGVFLPSLLDCVLMEISS